MVRQRRDDFPGAWHHVMHRGARRAPIFKLSSDCIKFQEYLAETVGRFGIELHAFSLMPNHYHLLIRSMHANLSKAMQYINGSFTLWLNKRHRWDGPVFRGRFKSQLVDSDAYLRILVAYIHLNPLEAHMVPRLTSEAWTSHRAYIGKESVPDWLTIDLFLELFDGPAGLHDFILSVRRGATDYPEDFDTRTGLFRKKSKSEEAPQPKGRPVVSSRKPKPRLHRRLRPADEVIAKVCKLTKASIAELRRKEMGPGANPARRFAIWALDHSSVLNQNEIGHLLGVPYHQVTRLLGRLRKESPEPLAGWKREWLRDEEG